VFRCYATLSFIVVVDGDESELSILDLIQIVVECLDRIFQNVCEVDLVMNPEKVCPSKSP